MCIDINLDGRYSSPSLNNNHDNNKLNTYFKTLSSHTTSKTETCVTNICNWNTFILKVNMLA